MPKFENHRLQRRRGESAWRPSPVLLGGPWPGCKAESPGTSLEAGLYGPGQYGFRNQCFITAQQSFAFSVFESLPICALEAHLLVCLRHLEISNLALGLFIILRAKGSLSDFPFTRNFQQHSESREVTHHNHRVWIYFLNKIWGERIILPKYWLYNTPFRFFSVS